MHDHNWLCSEVPGIFECECGAEKYYDRSTKTFKHFIKKA